MGQHNKTRKEMKQTLKKLNKQLKPYKYRIWFFNNRFYLSSNIIEYYNTDFNKVVLYLKNRKLINDIVVLK